MGKKVRAEWIASKQTINMCFLKYVYLLAGSFLMLPVFGQNPTNLLLIHSNDPISFDRIDANTIRDAVSRTIQLSDSRVQQIVAGMKPGAGQESTLMAYDEIAYELNDLGMKLQLISATYISDSTRNAADNGLQSLTDYQTSLILNEPLYKAMKTYAAASLASLKPNQQKYVRDQIQVFENNGMKLDSAGRMKLQAVSDRLTAIGIAFDRNIATSRDSIIYTEPDLVGVPDRVKQAWKKPDGQFVVYINTPNSTDISRYAISESAREKMNFHYKNRAYPANIQVLDSLLYYRQQYAQILGYKSYAAYALTDKMAGNPQAVWNFEHKLVEKLTPHVTEDIQSLRTLKHQMHPELADTLYAWDVNFYKKILLDTKYQLNTDEVKEYFEMNQTISGMFEVYHELLGITIKETFGLPVWYNKVRSFDMYLDGKKIGSFYFDLYPRANKFNHFECAGISAANRNGGKEILPVAALICNFPEAVSGTPTLLDHSDVIVLIP